ncbi:MAG: glycosyltransferase family 4 protein [Thermoplasmatales archaeon]|nr:glycosyltransferase family 4 protein [Thermoplasmatales archaeon]
MKELKLLVVGHALHHPRQYMLLETIAVEGLASIRVLAPSHWHDEKCTMQVKHNYELYCLEPVGKNFYQFRLRGLKQHVLDYKPDIIYIEEEPHTIQARECSKIAKEEGVPYACYSWENIPERRFGEPLDSIEKEVISGADILLAASEDAKQRLLARGAEEEKIAICPMNGINCDVFKPMKDTEKDYDLMYAGRHAEEKGVKFIEQVAKELHLNMLWIGGRGEIYPSYGNYIGWLPDYLQLPEYYNKSKLFVTYPYSYHGYKEQMNFTIAEGMACGTPVITSNNGSIPEIYSGAPISIVDEGKELSLKEAISFVLSDLEIYPHEEGIKWVRQHLSNEVVGKKVIKILKDVI